MELMVIYKPIDIKKLMRTLQVFIDYWFESVILPDAKS